MKEFKYTIDGQEYTVQIEGVEGNIASLNVNGEAFKVEMEKEAEPEKKKVVLVSQLLSRLRARQPALPMSTQPMPSRLRCPVW